jgi:hypothetical protein
VETKVETTVETKAETVETGDAETVETQGGNKPETVSTLFPPLFPPLTRYGATT